eukprot:957715-Amphidinium_carterae.1
MADSFFGRQGTWVSIGDLAIHCRAAIWILGMPWVFCHPKKERAMLKKKKKHQFRTTACFLKCKANLQLLNAACTNPIPFAMIWLVICGQLELSINCVARV